MTPTGTTIQTTVTTMPDTFSRQTHQALLRIDPAVPLLPEQITVVVEILDSHDEPVPSMTTEFTVDPADLIAALQRASRQLATNGEARVTR